MLRRASVLLVGLGMVLGACGGGLVDETTRDENGDLVEGGALTVFSLQAGDCLLDPSFGAAAEVVQTTAVPCDERHNAEVFALFDLADGSYPGETVVGSEGETGCLSRFQGYVGVPFEESVYNVTLLYPTAQSWDSQDDREIVCLLLGDGEMTGSARGTAR